MKHEDFLLDCYIVSVRNYPTAFCIYARSLAQAKVKYYLLFHPNGGRKGFAEFLRLKPKATLNNSYAHPKFGKEVVVDGKRGFAVVPVDAGWDYVLAGSDDIRHALNDEVVFKDCLPPDRSQAS